MKQLEKIVVFGFLWPILRWNWQYSTRYKVSSTHALRFELRRIRGRFLTVAKFSCLFAWNLACILAQLFSTRRDQWWNNHCKREIGTVFRAEVTCSIIRPIISRPLTKSNANCSLFWLRLNTWRWYKSVCPSVPEEIIIINYSGTWTPDPPDTETLDIECDEDTAGYEGILLHYIVSSYFPYSFLSVFIKGRVLPPWIFSGLNSIRVWPDY